MSGPLDRIPPSLRRAVFLDRDGVINRALEREGLPYPPASLAEFEILPNVPAACAKLKKAGFLLVVATNQPDVGRGTMANRWSRPSTPTCGRCCPLTGWRCVIMPVGAGRRAIAASPNGHVVARRAGPGD